MKDIIQDQDNERSPLLLIQDSTGSSPLLQTNPPTYSDTQPLIDIISTRQHINYSTNKSFSRPLKIMLISFISISFILFNLHQIVIPHRIQQQLNAQQGLTIDSITLNPFTPTSSVTFSVKGVRLVAVHPPTTITLSKTRLDIQVLLDKLDKPRRIRAIQHGFVHWFGFGLKEWTQEDAYYSHSQNIGHFNLPDQITPTNVDSVELDIKSAFKVNTKGMKRMLGDLERVEMVRMQGIAKILFENIGDYRIPMWTTVKIQDKRESGFNASIVDKKVTMEYDPITRKPFYQVEITLLVINSTPLIIQKQPFGLTSLVFYKNQEILSITLPMTTLSINQGLNTKKVLFKTNPERMDALMEFIGRYSEGEEMNVCLKEMKGIYNASSRRIGWMDEILDGFEFNITIPAGNEDLFGVKRKNILVN